MTTSKLSPLKLELAALYDVRCNNKLTKLVKQAKEALGIDKNTRSLTADDNAAIIEWHKTQLATDYQQTDFIKLGESVDTSLDTSITGQVETTADDNAEASPIEPIAVIPKHTIIESPTDSNNTVDNETMNNDSYSNNTVDAMAIDNEPYSDNTVIDDTRYSNNAVVKIAFRTNTYGENKRQCVTLEGNTVNLLMLAAGIDKKGVAKWVQNAVNEWSPFDDKLPITRQVRRLITRAIESQLIKARG